MQKIHLPPGEGFGRMPVTFVFNREQHQIHSILAKISKFHPIRAADKRCFFVAAETGGIDAVGDGDLGADDTVFAHKGNRKRTVSMPRVASLPVLRALPVAWVSQELPTIATMSAT